MGTDFFPPAADKDKPKASQNPFSSVKSVPSVFHPVAFSKKRRSLKKREAHKRSGRRVRRGKIKAAKLQKMLSVTSHCS